MIKRVLFVFLLGILHLSVTFAQNSIERQWAEIDSLIEKGLPKSAAEVAEKIRLHAEKQGDIPYIIKANLFLMQVSQSTQEQGAEKNIQKAEQFIKETKGVARAVWQSIAAERYWNYFQNNRFKIYDRTTLAENRSDDISVWDARMFFKKISALYVASLEQFQLLQETPVEQFAPLIYEGKNTRVLRPSMYDLLTFRALKFFENDEKDLTQPSDIFKIEESFWFESAEHFTNQKINANDSTSLQRIALKLYQELLKNHMADNRRRALVDADMHRLEFVFKNSVHPDKDSLYLAALQNLKATYAYVPEIAEVSFRIAEQKYIQGGPISNIPHTPLAENDTPKRDLPTIVRQLNEIIQTHPKTEGSSHAQRLLNTIENKTLSIQTEEVQIPNENIRALIQYKNASQIHLSVFRVPNTPNTGQFSGAKEQLSFLKNEKPIWTSRENIPGSADMELHSTEIKVDPLKPGRYLLTVSLDTDFSDNKNVISSTYFQVSSISIITHRVSNQTWLYTLDRKSGQPLANRPLTFWDRSWDNSAREYHYSKSHQGKTDQQGVLKIDNKANFQYMTVVSGADTLQSPLNHRRTTSTTNPEKKIKEKTFFFTDRAIYRPGQTVYFKGIVVASEYDGRRNRVVPEKIVEVIFYDANGQKIDSTRVKSNEFGSFTGTFIAPENVMTGNMRISSKTGSTSISVEEYKRPKFYVKFDTLSSQYALNQDITLTASAIAYAGNTLDGAQVRYRVVRRARFPYFWMSYRWGGPTRSPEMEIANGTTQTGKNGSFEVSFTTIPDKGIEPGRLPVFSYQVLVEVTDINGETQSGSESIQAGYRSMQIVANVPEQALPGQLDTLSVSTRNLSNNFTAARLRLQIKPLIFPGKLFRDRVWPLPDQYVYTESQFRDYFPADAYKQEHDYHFWKTDEVLYENSWTTTSDGKLEIPSSLWDKSGWYVFEFSGKDNNGKEILEKKYCYIISPKKQTEAQIPLIAQVSQDVYSPDQVAEIWVQTGFENVYLLETATDSVEGGGPHHRSSPIHHTRNIVEADRGGIFYSWLYVYNNRVYNTTQKLNVPWSERDLKLEWSSHRSDLRPGEEEIWTLTIQGPKKDIVASELVATLYDASLDAFKPHHWNWSTLTPQNRTIGFWGTSIGFGAAPHQSLKYWPNTKTPFYEKRYDRFQFGFSTTKPVALNEIRIRGVGKVAAAPNAVYRSAEASEVQAEKNVMEYADSMAAETQEVETETPDGGPFRTNLQETAFFFPQLRSNAQGEVQLEFTAPEALTEWKLMAFAHTPDWKTGILEGKVHTQKELMVMPNLPRFFRQGDAIEITSKIANLSKHALSGKAHIEILDALTMQPITPEFKIENNEKPFQVLADESSSVSWTLQIPDTQYNPIVVRISGKSKDFADGEEHILPIVTNRTLVTETLPLWVHGNQEKSFVWENLARNHSSSRVNHALTLEFTGNPSWYAVQALPYLTERRYESAEQIFNRYYANALASHIVHKAPAIKTVLERWKSSDSSAMKSALENNQDLKTVLLEETPWVLEANNESEQKQRITKLFQQSRLQDELTTTLKKLLDTQLDNGGFPWFKGMYHNRYITQYIVSGIGRLKKLGAIPQPPPILDKLLEQAIAFTDEQLRNDYQHLVDAKADLNKRQVGHNQIFYLYMRSFFPEKEIPSGVKSAFAYYKQQASQYWNEFNPYMKGQIALALYRLGDSDTPREILASLKETAVINEEFGMYWKSARTGHHWYQAPVESQALLIEAFSEIASDKLTVDDLKIWLLKQKQTQHWKTTKSTADACYALLLEGTDWLVQQPEVRIRLGDQTVHSSHENTVAGTGYFKKTFEPQMINSKMSHISVEVDKPEDKGTSWGGLYWQYFEDLDQIESAESPLSLRKELYIVRDTEEGPLMTEITEQNPIKVGDKIQVRIEIRVDRDMDYVHLKDMRASTFEPLNVISGYKFQGGLGYFENTRDLSTNFFFDHLRKGTYVFEYPMYVNQTGTFSNGIAIIQSMYAPEFSSHSDGTRIEVK